MSRRIYYVVATSRTGSTWLCKMLASSGVAGCPQEFGWYTFDPFQLSARWNQHADDDPFGSKVTCDELVRLWGREMSIDECRDCRIVWLRRRDRLAQAVSLYRASESNCWYIGLGEDVPAAIGRVPFDREKIIERYQQIECQEALIGHWLSRHAVPFLEIWYEDLVADPDGVTRSVLAFLEFDSRVSLTIDHSKRMGDATTDDWIRRMRDGD